MQSLSATEFRKLVANDPKWASKLSTPTEIWGVVNLDIPSLECLSPLLHFKGSEKSNSPHCVKFLNIQRMKKFEGNFYGKVHLENCTFEEFGDFTIHCPNNLGEALQCNNCKNLRAATGTFPGSAYFLNCGIKIIDRLKITKPNKEGKAASFWMCQNLLVAEGSYPGYVEFGHSGVNSTKNLQITATDSENWAVGFQECLALKTLSGKYPGFIDLNKSGIINTENLEISQGSTPVLIDGIQYKDKLVSFLGCKHLKRLPKNIDPENILMSLELKHKLNKDRIIRKLKSHPLQLS